MFSRNRCNGQDGTGAPQCGRPKSKPAVHRRRQPNPKVAIMLRGKIHRLLQGSTDYSVPASQLYYAGIEEEDQEEPEDLRKVQGCYRRARAPDEVCNLPRVPNGKEQDGVAGACCVGEVELNQEGGIRIPCTLQHINPTELHTTQDVNGPGFRFGRGLAGAPSACQKDLLYRFNVVMQEKIVEEDEDECPEEESSAIIEHILKELKGINKIQEEISDLREYLSTVRGSVEEVSSCVDAVLMEIEGIRSGSRSGVETWPGAGSKHDHHPSDNPFSETCDKLHTVECMSCSMQARNKVFDKQHNQTCPPRLKKDSRRAPHNFTNTNDPAHDPFGHGMPVQSLDIPPNTVRRKQSLGYSEHQDGQECLSTSSLSSGQSSKSESDQERPSSGRVCSTDEVQNWDQTGLVHSGSGETRWSEEDPYSRQGSFEEGSGEVDNWVLMRDEGACTELEESTSEHFSVSSNLHYNSPASTCSRDEWHGHRSKPNPCKMEGHPEGSTLEYSDAEGVCEYSKTSGYQTAQSSTPSHQFISADCKENITSSLSEICTHFASNMESMENVFDPVKRGYTTSSREYVLEQELDTDESNDVGFNVKKFGRAVLDFKSALKMALKKLEAGGASSPVEKADTSIEPQAGEDLLDSESPSEEVPQVELPSVETLQGEISNANTSALSQDCTPDPDHVEPNKYKSNSSNPCETIPESVERSIQSIKTLAVERSSEATLHSTMATHPDCLTTKSRTVSLSADEHRQETSEEPIRELAEDGERERDHPVELSERDVRRLKCLRTFQQILREKRESRRRLGMVTMCSFSEGDFNPGTYNLFNHGQTRILSFSS